MQRRYGPTQGAGVVVIEKEAEKLLTPAPLGVTAHVGVYQRGATDEMISTFSKKDAVRKLGAIIDESDASQAAHDFWDASAGAGELYASRVTDGSGVLAELTLFNRKTVFAQAMTIQAHDVGRWAGRIKKLLGEMPTDVATDLTETTLDTGATMLLNEWTGGYVYLDGVAVKRYPIVSNTTAGVITVRSDSTMLTDIGVGTDKGYRLWLEDNDINCGVLIGEAEITDEDAFSCEVYTNGDLVKRWPNLSIDPDSKYYFVPLINDDTSNYEIQVTDLASPPTPDDKYAVPANDVGTIDTVTATLLTRDLFQQRVESPTAANPVVALGATTDVMRHRDIIKCTVLAGAATFDATSEILGDGATIIAAGTIGSPETPTTPWLPAITITNGGTVLAVGDIVYIDYFPWEPDALIGSKVIPDWVDNPLVKFLITDNDHKSLTVGAGQDMTAVASGGDDFVLQAVSLLKAGNDGIAELDDGDYTPHFDISSSPFNALIDQGKGLVKFGCPGKTATAVVKAMAAYVQAKNWQCRYEIPNTTQDEVGAINQINTTYGRNDFAVCAMPSFGYINDPNRSGTMKLVSLTGQIHGLEALYAKNYDGYQKAASDVNAVLSKVLKVDATELNEELLNPVGLQIIKKKNGNFIVWGDRTVAIDPAWKWKHQRELMSHYENRLRESYDFIIFAINSKSNWGLMITSLRAFFLPEYAKDALKGDTFADAAIIKIDADINTPVTEAQGDLNAEISLGLADTVERFIITIGKQGIFEQVA